jgi:hypothetical protein
LTESDTQDRLTTSVKPKPFGGISIVNTNKPFHLLAITELTLDEIQEIARTGISADVVSKEIVGEIANSYFRPISLSDLAEIIREVIFRDQLSVSDAVCNWADDKDEYGYDIADLTLSSGTCRWGIIVDGLLPQQLGWTTVSAVRFEYKEMSFMETLDLTKLFVNAYQANVRIYSLPLNHSSDETSRHAFGESGYLVANIPYLGSENCSPWIASMPHKVMRASECQQ